MARTKRPRMGESIHNPAKGKDGCVFVQAPSTGSVWIDLPRGGLIEVVVNDGKPVKGVNFYGGAPVVVVYGREDVKIRRAGQNDSEALVSVA